MTTDEVANLLTFVQGHYPNFTPNEYTFDAWEMMLQPIPKEHVDAVLPDILEHHHEFAPTPALIRKRVIESQTGLASGEQAWALVEKAIGSRGSWGGPDPDWPVTITRAVNALDWNTICQTKIEEMGYLRKDFLRFYESFRDQALGEVSASLGTGSLVKEIAG